VFLLFETIAILVGVIIGAGILGIPYVVAQCGFLIGFINFVFLSLIVVFINLCLGEITLRTKERYQLIGYAGKYFGRNGKYLMFFLWLLANYGSLLVYMIGGGEVLSAIFSGRLLFYSFLFWTIGAVLVYFGLNIIKKAEFLMVMVILVMVVLVGLISFGHIDISHLVYFNINKFFLPYGVILYALWGMIAIPEMREVLKGKEELLKKAILWGSVIPVIIYSFFALAVIGVTGISTTEIATIGLGKVLGKGMVLFGNVFAIFAMMTSFLVVGLGQKSVFYYDYKMSNFLSWLFTFSIPLVALLLGMRGFTKNMALVGAVSEGLVGVMVITMYWRAKRLGDRSPEFSFMSLKGSQIAGSIIILILIGGIVYTLISV